jgi:superfamily II DNA or RNA helicase/HKD family nuclease
MDKTKELLDGLQTAFINTGYNSNLAYRPEFISNDYKKGKKVLTSIEQELQNCDEFCMSVAFIKQSGIESLLMTLEELGKRNIPGKILTTDYMTFSEPKALKCLASLKNIKIKMFRTSYEVGGFHTKGYIFKKEEIYRIIIGSSNLTSSAITKNREWNTKIVSTEKGQVAHDILREFNELWSDEHSLDYDDFIDDYQNEYTKNQLIKIQQKLALQEQIVDLDRYTLKPNKMQVAFVDNVMKMRQKEVDRALLLSSTGTGKSLASAFALREMQPKKILFLVHREQIAKQTIRSYKRVFGNTKTYGLLSGTSENKKMDAEYLFSTIQMMKKPEIHTQFAKDEFDVIVLDECHHVGSDSYQQTMNYFKPKFWLGMTATPDTKNYDIYTVFDHQIAYEIRLQQALEEDLLCPFHYFGITEMVVDGKVFDDNTGVRNFSNLVSDSRVEYVIQKAEYYGYSGKRVKGLIFCSRKDEAKELSANFNRRGYRTEVLTGEDSPERREMVIERLTDDDNIDNQLDYIFTVDIFNEGVDIPEINQVIMLRPTESPVVFIQQLGRGLRKYEDKEYVVILDFIGNYMNNFMIPIALSGDRSYNKDTIRKYVISGNNVIPGASTIHFDEISKNKIFSSIDRIKGIKEIIKQSYKNLKNRMGKIPYLMDFYYAGEVDPLLILSNYKTYQAFIESMEGKEQKRRLSEGEVTTLEYLSRNIASGKRPHELEILQELISTGTVTKEAVKNHIAEKYDIYVGMESIDNAISVLEGKFVSKSDELEKYCHIDIVQQDLQGTLRRVSGFYERLKHAEFSRQVNDILLLGLRRYQDNYTNKNDYRENFILYEKYARRDVCLLLNWGKDYSSTMYGMKRIEDNVCIFVTYHKVKSEDEQEYVNGKPDYADEFMDNQTFMWDSQIGKGPDSSYMNDVKEAKKKYLFVKKSDAEMDFYYMGMFDIENIEIGEKKDNSGKLKDIAKVEFRMHDCVREDLLKYLKSVDKDGEEK